MEYDPFTRGPFPVGVRTRQVIDTAQWAALAVPAVDGRIRAVLALAPGGSAQPRPGIIPATLTFT